MLVWHESEDSSLRYTPSSSFGCSPKWIESITWHPNVKYMACWLSNSILENAGEERDRREAVLFFFPEGNNHPLRFKSTQMKVDYIVLIQLILYSLSQSCFELLGFENASWQSWNGKAEATQKEGEKGPSSEVDISLWMMLQPQQNDNAWTNWCSYNSNCTWIVIMV